MQFQISWISATSTLFFKHCYFLLGTFRASPTIVNYDYRIMRDKIIEREEIEKEKEEEKDGQKEKEKGKEEEKDEQKEKEKGKAEEKDEQREKRHRENEKDEIVSRNTARGEKDFSAGMFSRNYNMHIVKFLHQHSTFICNEINLEFEELILFLQIRYSS